MEKCKGKNKYITLKWAERQRDEAEKRGKIIEIYTCQICGWYHLTSHPKQTKEEI